MGLPVDDSGADEPLLDKGRSLPLRLLALVGALSFVMLGVSSLVLPFLQLREPQPMPDQRRGSLS